MLAQGVLPFQLEEGKRDKGLTSLSGLPIFLELATVIGLAKSVEKHLKIREGGQGWTDAQMIVALVLLNLAGGDCVDDLRILEGDEGFRRILARSETHGLKRKVRRALQGRWRKERRRMVPSASATFRFLSGFHDEEQEKLREPGKAFIPASNQHLLAMPAINKDFMGFLQRRHPESLATIDMDATITETTKREALYAYTGVKGYQPLNIYWAEQGVMVHTEFRDGNVPAGYQQKRVLIEALEQLPESVEKVRLRSDTAGYQHDLLEYCYNGENPRFGRIEFAIGADVSPEFKKAVMAVKEGDWKPIYREDNGEKKETGRQWAEVCFVPNEIAFSKKAPEYRYLATREELKQMELPDMQRELPFPTACMGSGRYKIFGIVTNLDWHGEEVIKWLYQRCGASEEAHYAIKEELAGGRFPSKRFGENAAWWWIAILSFNLNAIMKRLVLEPSWATKRLKAIRFSLINLPGRVLRRSRQLVLRLAHGHPSFEVLRQARSTIARLALNYLYG
jgi:hypothetical protein